MDPTLICVPLRNSNPNKDMSIVMSNFLKESQGYKFNSFVSENHLFCPFLLNKRIDTNEIDRLKLFHLRKKKDCYFPGEKRHRIKINRDFVFQSCL